MPSRKARALVAYLALRPGQSHPRDKLAALLWAELSDARARDGLRHALAACRQAFLRARPPILLVEGQSLAFNPAAADIDVVTFEQRVAEGTIEAVEEAAALYRGDLLSGFSLNEPLFEEWLIPQRERLRELALEALANLLAHQSQAGPPERAVQTAVRLLGLDPLQEIVHRALMRLYVRQGRRGAALKQYQRCVVALQRELGTEPELETRHLYHEILCRKPLGSPQASPETRSRTQHRTGPLVLDRPSKDVPLIGREPELSRILPAKAVPLFGRDADRAWLRRALDDASRGRAQLARPASSKPSRRRRSSEVCRCRWDTASRARRSCRLVRGSTRSGPARSWPLTASSTGWTPSGAPS